MGEERRSSERIGISIGARIFNSTNEIVMGEGKIMDMSLGGAKLVTVAKFDTGDVMQLEFLVHRSADSEKDKVVMTCEVETVWKIGEEKGEVNIYGVKFVSLSEMSKTLINRFIEYERGKQ